MRTIPITAVPFVSDLHTGDTADPCSAVTSYVESPLVANAQSGAAFGVDAVAAIYLVPDQHSGYSSDPIIANTPYPGVAVAAGPQPRVAVYPDAIASVTVVLHQHLGDTANTVAADVADFESAGDHLSESGGGEAVDV